MFGQLGISGPVALQVVIGTAGVYLAFLLLIRILGPRVLAPTSAVDIGCIIALGAIVGRTGLLATPSLAGGVIALVTLFVLQRLVGTGHRRRRTRWLISRAPVALVVDGKVMTDETRRVRIDDDELRQLLRLAGVARLHDVHLAVLERNGQVSVVRGTAPEPWLTADIPQAATTAS
jgi:uncharacterized membrane protein YcaP (DUF421 family)